MAHSTRRSVYVFLSLPAAVLALFALAPWGCGSDSSSAGGSAGTSAASGAPSTGGNSATGGAPATGGSATAGATSSGGATGVGGSAAGSGAGGAMNMSGAGGINAPWDWSGVVGTGQSLSVGEPGPGRGTASATVKATTQPYNNLKLSTGNAAWPLDPNDPSFAMAALIEPIGRIAPNYPSSWPTNIAGETYHAAMANQITALVQAASGADYIGVHGEFGENGQCLSLLKKNAVPVGITGRAYEGTLVETRAITRLAQAMGKTYGVGAIVVTHGECDAGNATYETDLHTLWSDYSQDLPAITGQTQKPIMIVSQQNAVNDHSASTLAQWKIGVDYAADVVCSGPKYQYPYPSDALHLIVDGYEGLGEKYGQVYFERVVLGHAWLPLQPLTVERSARVITVHFHVPVAPLVWEDTFQLPHQTSLSEWSAGKGFEVRAGATRLAISSVAIVGDAVALTLAADPPTTGVFVGYALSANPMPMSTPFAGTTRWGLLRDSDPFVGRMTQKAQPNFAVAFELPVP